MSAASVLPWIPFVVNECYTSYGRSHIAGELPGWGVTLCELGVYKYHLYYYHSRISTWRCSYRDLPYASIDFLEPACGLRQWAAVKFGKRVVQKLGETSTYTLLVDEQHFWIKLPSYMQGIASAVRGGRAQVGDVARYCEKDISCPAGCSAGGGSLSHSLGYTWRLLASTRGA